MSDSPGTRKKSRIPGGGPLGSLGMLLVFVGLAITLIVSAVPGVIISAVGLACCITDAVSPGRDVYGRRRR